MDKILREENIAVDTIENFFSDPEIPDEVKKRPKERARKGQRRENIHLKKLEKEGACVETVVRSPKKSYKKLNVPPHTKQDTKKASNRSIRYTEGTLPVGAAYKKGTEVIDDVNDDTEE